jgi:hypothetical protein
MAGAVTFSSFIYDNKAFKDLMNANYKDDAAMRSSIAKLQASPQIDIETMEFGQYQPILSDSTKWPNGGGMAWVREVGRARMQFIEQPNTTPLSNDQSDFVPLTRCGLLDACVRKCFNSEPPIPMTIDVQQKAMTATAADQHAILLVWGLRQRHGQAADPAQLDHGLPLRGDAEPIHGLTLSGSPRPAARTSGDQVA